MKLTKQQLKEIIREEINTVIIESDKFIFKDREYLNDVVHEICYKISTIYAKKLYGFAPTWYSAERYHTDADELAWYNDHNSIMVKTHIYTKYNYVNNEERVTGEMTVLVKFGIANTNDYTRFKQQFRTETFTFKLSTDVMNNVNTYIKKITPILKKYEKYKNKENLI